MSEASVGITSALMRVLEALPLGATVLVKVTWTGRAGHRVAGAKLAYASATKSASAII
jgi:hypothetical protein